jgi:uncharacterized protein YkwD
MAMVVAATVALVAAVPQSADAARSPERRFVQMINVTRSGAALPTLDMSDRLSDVARRHSRRMASAGELFHSDLERLLGHGISLLGENVGYGGSLEQLRDAFMASPPHAHNILGSFQRTGVGVIRHDGTIWITQIFAS